MYCFFIGIILVLAYMVRTTLDKYQKRPGADAIVIMDDLTFRADPSTRVLVDSVLNDGE